MPPIFGTPYIHPHGMTQSNQIVYMMIKLDERKALQSRSRFRSRSKVLWHVMLTRDLFGVADFLLYFLVPHFLSHILTILQQLGLSLNHISYMISSHKLRGSSAEEYNKCSYS